MKLPVTSYVPGTKPSRVVPIDVCHSPFVRVLDDHIRTNQRFAGLRVSHLSSDDALSQDLSQNQHQTHGQKRTNHAQKFGAKVFSEGTLFVNPLLRNSLTFTLVFLSPNTKKKAGRLPGFPRFEMRSGYSQMLPNAVKNSNKSEVATAPSLSRSAAQELSSTSSKMQDESSSFARGL